MISKEKSCHPPTKKNNYELFPRVLRKIRIVKEDGSFKVTEVNRSILGALSYFSLKTRKPVDFKKTLSYSLSRSPLSIRKLDGTRQQTGKRKFERYITARPRRTYQRRTTASSRICNYCR